MQMNRKLYCCALIGIAFVVMTVLVAACWVLLLYSSGRISYSAVGIWAYFTIQQYLAPARL